jgi:hypothetical protein
MTHTAKDCLERPRKLGAKWTNKDIAADEVVYAERAENYDSKRDRWDGYDPASHKAVVEEHEALEAARQQLREEAVDKATDIKAVAKVAKAGKKKKKDDDFGSSDESDDDDDDKYADGADVAGQKLDTKNVRGRPRPLCETASLTNPIACHRPQPAHSRGHGQVSSCVVGALTASPTLTSSQATSTSSQPTTTRSPGRCARRQIRR